MDRLRRAGHTGSAFHETRRRILLAAHCFPAFSHAGSLPQPTREKAVAFIVRFLDSPSAELRRAATQLLGGHTHYGVTVSRGSLLIYM